MSEGVIQSAISVVLNSGLVADDLSIVWHAGEPLTVPVSFYESAVNVIASLCEGVRVHHSIQTNATLINDEWCRFFRRHSVKVGVSVDGPAFIHDRHRVTRQARGTHHLVMKGIESLRKHRIPFDVIAVVTADSLSYPDEIFKFFEEHELERVGFNFEESEGSNQESTLNTPRSKDRVITFLRRLYDLNKLSSRPIRIREFDGALGALTASIRGSEVKRTSNPQVRPFGIISIDCDGNISSFSPELLGATSPAFPTFSFGNVRDSELIDLLGNPTFLKVGHDVSVGVESCAKSCSYFAFCGGGAPANKLYENGSFASTETMYCRNSVQAPLQVVLQDLERTLGLELNDSPLPDKQ